MIENPVILALDQSSTRTGWVRGRPEGPVTCGSYSNPKFGQRYGRSLNAYQMWLESVLEGVDVLAFEQPVRPFSKLNLHTARLLYGIAGVIEMTAEQRGLDCFEADTGEMKKLIYGKGGKKPEPPVAIRKAQAWGFSPANGDEADACGVFLFVVKNRFERAFNDFWFETRRAA